MIVKTVREIRNIDAWAKQLLYWLSASGTYTYDTARVRQHKDRYSALAMAVRYVAELEEARKRKLTSRNGTSTGVVTGI